MWCEASKISFFVCMGLDFLDWLGNLLRNTVYFSSVCVSLLSLQIGITQHSFATDGDIWLVTLACGSVLTVLLRIYPSLEFSITLSQLYLQPGLWLLSVYIVHIFVIHRRVHKPDQIVTSRPGDTILIGAGGNHRVSNIQIKKPLCLVCLWMIICLVWWLDISWRFLHFHDMSLSFP